MASCTTQSRQPMSSVTIVGNGAIGNLLAWRCENLALDWQLKVRGVQHAQIQVQYQQQTSTIAPRYLHQHQRIETDVLVLPLKAYQIRPAIEQLAPLLSKTVSVLLLHNGMGPHRDAQQLLPDNPIAVATTSYGAFKATETQLHVTGQGQTQAGWLNCQHKNLKTEALISSLLPPCCWSDNVFEVLWTKLAVNAVINPLTAALNIKNGELLAAQFGPRIRLLCEQTARVMQALNLDVTSQFLIERCRKVAKDTADNYSSMCQDIRLGRPTEIDHISGYIVQQASDLNIDVPDHRQLLDKIKQMQAKSACNS